MNSRTTETKYIVTVNGDMLKLRRNYSPIRVENDLQPLESIFKKPLYWAPMRLQRMFLRLQWYTVKVIYRPGKELNNVDALSRNYLQEQKDLLGEELGVNWVTPQLLISEEKLNMFQKITADDPEILQDITINGWLKERIVSNKCSNTGPLRTKSAMHQD